jgi:hypothetical protein
MPGCLDAVEPRKVYNARGFTSRDSIGKEKRMSSDPNVTPPAAANNFCRNQNQF